MSGDGEKMEYIIEFQQHGASVKVSAIDAATLTEVSLVGPSTARREDLQRAALQKLLFVLGKNGAAKEKAAPSEARKKPGIIV